jgi:hypothetical protein
MRWLPWVTCLAWSAARGQESSDPTRFDWTVSITCVPDSQAHHSRNFAWHGQPLDSVDVYFTATADSVVAWHVDGGGASYALLGRKTFTLYNGSRQNEVSARSAVFLRSHYDGALMFGTRRDNDAAVDLMPDSTTNPPSLWIARSPATNHCSLFINDMMSYEAHRSFQLQARLRYK